MNRTGVIRRPRHSRRLRAAGMLWFVLFAFPIYLFGGLLAIDLSRVVTVSRNVAAAAEAAAVGGAAQYQRGTGELNRTTAEAVARDVVVESGNVGTYDAADVNVDVAVTTDSVTVTVDYTTERLLFVDVLSAYSVQAPGPLRRTLERTAFVCLPGDPGATAGFCARPRR